MPHRPSNNQSAFTLLEILAAVGVIAVIFFFVNQMVHFFGAQSNVSKTRTRMEEIVEKAKAYYLNHENLPLISVSPVVPITVPLASPAPASADQGFDIDPKLRFDSWGREIQYVSYSNDGSDNRPGQILIDPLEAGGPAGAPIAMVIINQGTRTLIRAIEFEGRRVAALLISSGPDQQFNYPPPTPPGAVGDPIVYTADPGSDDIFMTIDVNTEAIQIATTELKSLNEKVGAFNDRYLGIDNDGDNPPQYDEANCQGIRYPVNVTVIVPPTVVNCSDLPSVSLTIGETPPDTAFDVSCGWPTLDYMKANFCTTPGVPPGYSIAGRNAIGTVTETSSGNFCAPFTFARPAVTPDYAHIGNCYWGLVRTQDGIIDPTRNETDGDQARAFIACLFDLDSEAIADPWLNGYIWGCGDTEESRDTTGTFHGFCTNAYSVNDPHYHKFFSAGPDGIPAAPGDPPPPSDDIIF